MCPVSAGLLRARESSPREWRLCAGLGCADVFLVTRGRIRAEEAGLEMRDGRAPEGGMAAIAIAIVRARGDVSEWQCLR